MKTEVKIYLACVLVFVIANIVIELSTINLVMKLL